MTTEPRHSVRQTGLNLAERVSGKVRDTYVLPVDNGTIPLIALIATDRISAFDVVLPTPIPGKGRLLTEIAAFWLRMIEDRRICRTHLISTDATAIPDIAFSGATTSRDELLGRTMIGRQCHVIPIECVVRGYLEGSGWREYQQNGGVCGVALPEGLRQCDRLPRPIFTPATKALRGNHDENISFEQAAEAAGTALMERLRALSLDIYAMAARYAEERGIIIADTKFEFGFPIDASGRAIEDEPILIDEVLTPDSSRFWLRNEYAPGRAQRSLDKQFVREYLEGLVAAGDWDKTDPGPKLPTEVVEGTLRRYREARDRLTRSA